ncbi:MAG: hypothetical protein WHX52_06445 [Anaerolineae bacterium]
MHKNDPIEIHTVNLDIANLQAQYNVRSAADLRAKIERGDLPGHPAWEDAIEWEWLEVYSSCQKTP